MEQTYRSRLWRAALKNLREFWSSHRIWVTLSALVLPFAAQVVAHGWASLRQLWDNVLIASAGLALAVAGNCVIALWGGAKSLDASLREEIRRRDIELAAISERAQPDPAGEYHLRAARQAVEKLTMREKLILQNL